MMRYQCADACPQDAPDTRHSATQFTARRAGAEGVPAVTAEAKSNRQARAPADRSSDQCCLAPAPYARPVTRHLCHIAAGNRHRIHRDLVGGPGLKRPVSRAVCFEGNRYSISRFQHVE